MAQITTKFKVERETKGAVLYREIDKQGNPYSAPNAPGATIGNIYIRKTSLNGSIPDSITLIINY